MIYKTSAACSACIHELHKLFNTLEAHESKGNVPMLLQGKVKVQKEMGAEKYDCIRVDCWVTNSSA